MSDLENRLNKIEKQIKELVERAEKAQNSNPASAMWQARKACETICRQVCSKERLINGENNNAEIKLDTMISLIGKHKVAERHICDDMRTIQWKGNTGTHDLNEPPTSAAIPALAALANVSEWYFNEYGSKPINRKTYIHDEPEALKKSREIINKPTTKIAAVGVMAGTAVALVAKWRESRKGKEEA